MKTPEEIAKERKAHIAELDLTKDELSDLLGDMGYTILEEADEEQLKNACNELDMELLEDFHTGEIVNELVCRIVYPLSWPDAQEAIKTLQWELRNMGVYHQSSYRLL